MREVPTVTRDGGGAGVEESRSRGVDGAMGRGNETTRQFRDETTR